VRQNQNAGVFRFIWLLSFPIFFRVCPEPVLVSLSHPRVFVTRKLR
jgi:hypothetical protein